jgi:hypothetical protein
MSPPDDDYIPKEGCKASKSKNGWKSVAKPRDKSSAKKTPRGPNKKKEKDVDMSDANSTSSHPRNPFNKHSDVPDNNSPGDSQGFDGQNEIDSRLEDDSDEKANTESNIGQQEKGDESNSQDTDCDYLIPLSPDSFEELRNSEGYVDKTKLILDFHCKFQRCTCILRQRRSGKTRAIQMLKSFYSVPRIDVDNYRPEAPPDPPSTKVFEGTFLSDPSKWDGSLKKDTNFIENNMGKWPVISLDFKDISFEDKSSVKREEVVNLFIDKIVKPAFKEYDYLLFIYIADEVCYSKYGSYSDKTYERLLSDFKLSKSTNMETKISRLFKKFGKDMPSFIKKFYKYYTGQINTASDIGLALKFLMEILNERYKNKVMVFVDEHDAPVIDIHSEMTLQNHEEDKPFEKSIEVYSEVACNFLKEIAKENPYLEKFLMFGISRGILELDNSGINNLDSYDVLDEKHSEYFGFYEDEVSKVVDSAFMEIRKDDKK